MQCRDAAVDGIGATKRLQQAVVLNCVFVYVPANKYNLATICVGIVGAGAHNDTLFHVVFAKTVEQCFVCLRCSAV